jgi:Holliday junction resolvase
VPDMQLDIDGNEIAVALVKRKNTAQAGRARERKVADVLRSEDWVVLKGTSFGVCDLAALREGSWPRLIEVKANRGGPYMNFRKGDRESMKIEAKRAGAQAWLAYWPPNGALQMIPEWEWPT